MSNQSVVQLNNLVKKIKGKTIVDHINLELREGEVFGFLGPNGAGKTTTIRMMVGLMNPTSGNVVIDGVDLKKDYEKAINQVGAIVENPELYDYLTGYQNLLHFSRMHNGVNKERIQEVIEQVGLTNRIHEKVKGYSLGMRQRLGLAQALLHKPKFIILDEPTNGLDPAGIREFRNHLRKIAYEDNVSIFVSSHLLSEIELMCDRIGIIQAGKLIDVRNVHEESQVPEWEITLNNPQQAAEMLGRKLSTNVIVREDSIQVKVEREQIPSINKHLVENDYQVFGIELMKQTLEDEFLKITGGEQVG
ncbi:ABC transporter ATP-binding protein [Pontibacillus litoralis]|uniref:Bacitracin ABC transporter ATP-binding protein n=1 Tax=Pontibacillus litoralis JSM 072002 TaxID=1385512 RepID=A0A0A5G3Y8_9BACI|nr:ABC transporter ATP-binding protein [Pontibacillus litoralis]KGX86769.1 bacitracin ABC transporter ATP-binding protein [Pontibacillus litoralis JSM 072002]